MTAYKNTRNYHTQTENKFAWTERIDLSTNIKSEMRSFKSNANIHKKEGGSYYVVSANKASSVTL